MTLVLLAIVVIVIYYLEVKLAQDPDFGQGPRRLPSPLMWALLGLHSMGTAVTLLVLASLFFAVLPSFGFRGP